MSCQRIRNRANLHKCHVSWNVNEALHCRQKTRDFVAACTNQRNNKPCPIMFCHKCLLNRYGEKAEEVVGLGEWSCPMCRGICNCSICMKKRGHQPTGILINTAKATGFSSVSEMLLKGAENCTDKVASPKKEAIILPKKRGKENSFDGNVDSNSPYPIDIKSKKVKGVNDGNIEDDSSMKIISQGPKKRKTSQEQPEDVHHHNRNIGVLPRETGFLGCEKKSKKMKWDRLDEMKNGLDEMKNKTLGSRTSPRKLKVNNKLSNPGETLHIGVDPKENVNTDIIIAKEDFVQPFKNEKNEKGERNITNNKNVLKHHIADFHAEMPLPLGRELTSIAGIDVGAEDVGNALQFLEFCAVFGKILEVKKGQPEHVLKDLLHGRTGRRGKFSLTVQFHIHLLSVVLTDLGEDAILSPSYGKNSWFHALKKCFSESQSVHKVQGLESIDKAADYETLNTSKKLRLLNILCDEVLATEKVRNWIDDQNTKVAENIKEARQKVMAAKDKEKSLKQKLHDDIAKAIIARHGASLSISDHEAIVSNIKAEAALAHAKVLESKSVFFNTDNQTSDAVRIEPMFIGPGGHAYWRLSCFGNSNVLRQNVGNEELLTLDEKWFAIDADGKEAVEKHICYLREKRLRSPRGFKCHNDRMQ